MRCTVRIAGEPKHQKTNEPTGRNTMQHTQFEQFIPDAASGRRMACSGHSKDAAMHGCKKPVVRGAQSAHSARRTSACLGNIGKQKSLLVVFEMG